jgi:hypothetical protein
MTLNSASSFAQATPPVADAIGAIYTYIVATELYAMPVAAPLGERGYKWPQGSDLYLSHIRQVQSRKT